jgi:hypothetical protein
MLASILVPCRIRILTTRLPASLSGQPRILFEVRLSPFTLSSLRQMLQMLLQPPIFVCRHGIAALLRLLLLYLRTPSLVLPFLTLFRQSAFPFVSLYFPHLPPVTRVPSSLALPFSLRPVHIFACPLSTADMGLACLFLASSCWGLERGGAGSVPNTFCAPRHPTRVLSLPSARLLGSVHVSRATI